MSSPTYPRVTANAVRLAAAYFPILMDCAKEGRTVTYGELIAEARARRPDDEDVSNAIPVSTGRKLDVIASFCRDRGLPDLDGDRLESWRRFFTFLLRDVQTMPPPEEMVCRPNLTPSPH